MQDDLNMAVQRYRHALDTLQGDMDTKKWGHLLVSRQLLDKATIQLKANLERASFTQKIQEELQYLSVQHRRVTRQLHQHMNKLEEDLQYVEKGLNKIRYMSDFVTNDLKFAS